MRGQALAERLYERLSGLMTFLGLLFLVVFMSERLIDPREPIHSILLWIGWVTWAFFFLEFGLRLLLSESKSLFFRRHWWQLILLALPFLAFIRLFAVARVTRMTRVGRALSAGIRGTLSARSRLAGRLGWVTSSTVIVVIVSADLLYGFADYPTYAAALHEAALATIAGQRTTATSGFAQVLEVVLATYSVVIVASLAASLGAFFLDPQRSGIEEAPD